MHRDMHYRGEFSFEMAKTFFADFSPLQRVLTVYINEALERSKALYIYYVSHNHLDLLFICWIRIQWLCDVHFLINFSFIFLFSISWRIFRLLPHSFLRDSQHFLATVMPCIVWLELYRCTAGKEKLPSNMKSTGFINPSLFGRYVIIIASSTWNHSHKQKISIEHRRWSLIIFIFFFTSPTSPYFLSVWCVLIGRTVDELWRFFRWRWFQFISTQKVLCTYRQ